MRLAKFLFFLIVIIVSFFVLSQTIFAEQKPAFVVIVNPVRGNEFWENDANLTPQETIKKQLTVVNSYDLPATWLLRYDALTDFEISSIFKDLKGNYELGAFLEITPSICQDAGVKYNESESWHLARSIFLSGYSQIDRRKLIDTYFERFKSVFGYYPKSVGAWWIDTYSLNYMREKYKIIANLDVSDQFSTDNYQIWGQYFGVPFYPAKRNALIPAQSPQEKIGIVTIQWAQRDPYNGYGNGVEESTYSLQANDYIKYHHLDTNYFQKLFEIYANSTFSKFAQVTVGLENNFDVYGGEFQKQLGVVSKLRNVVTPVTMSDFANWYLKSFPDTSPSHLIVADDPLGSNGKVIWYMNNYYRIGWFYDGKVSAIRDLREYNDSYYERCYAIVCNQLDFAITVSKPLDKATFGDEWVLDEGEISNFRLIQSNGRIKMVYSNVAGKERVIEFSDKDLSIDGEWITISGAILKALTPFQDNNSAKISFTPKNYQSDLPRFLISIPIFFSFLLIFFYIPGFLLLNFSRLDFGQTANLVVSIILGIVVFTLVSVIVAYLKLQLLLISLFLVAVIYYFKRGYWKELKLVSKFNRDKFWIIVAILACSLLQVLVVVKSGWSYPYGLGFWGPNGHDAIFHISVANQLINNGLPPTSGFFAGYSLKNYHLFADLMVAETYIITKINLLDLYFRLYPFFSSITLGLSTFILVNKLSSKFLASVLAIALVYLSGSFGWILALFKSQSIFSGESAFWAHQAISNQLNFPLAISLPIFLTAIFLVASIDFNKATFRNFLPLLLVFSSLVQFKIYAGILSLSLLLLHSVKDFIFKLSLSSLRVVIWVIILSVIFYSLNNFESKNLVIFSPLWFINTMIDAPDRVGWIRLSQARQAYLANNDVVKLIIVQVLGIVIFIIGNLGVRTIGLFALLPNFCKIKMINKSIKNSLAIVGIIGLIFPLFVIQKGTAWNTIQFIYYSLAVFAILAAVTFVELIDKIKLQSVRFLLTVLLLVLSLPTTIGTLSQYITSRPPARLSFSELEALNFLKMQDEGVVLTYPFNEKLRNRFLEPIQLFAYQSTAYVSAFSGKPVYLEDEMNLLISDYPIDDRLPLVKFFFNTKDTNWQKDFLNDSKIRYIYLNKFQEFKIDSDKLGISKIFENDEVLIYRVFSLH